MKNLSNDRTAALAAPALLAGAGYLAWRIGWTLGAPAWLAIPLIVAEAVALVRFGLQIATRGPRPGPGVLPGPAGSAEGRVELLVPAVGGGVEEVARTLAIAARTVEAPIRVLDSTHRADVAAETIRLGATYEVLDAVDGPGLIELARHSTSAEFIAWVDAGDVPVPGLLDLVTAFEDPTVAVVQSATNLINRDSLLHLSPERDERAIERNVEGPSLDRAGAAPWNGSGSVIRVAALAAVGGLPGGRSSATVRATTRLIRHGYAVRFCSLPLVRTVAPDTLDEYLAEAGDRAGGAWTALWSSDSPLRPGRMGMRARLAQIHAATAPLDGLIRFTYLAVLAAVLFTGTLPISAPLGLAVALFIPQLVLRGAVGIALSRGNTSLGEPTRQSLRLMGVHLGALVGLHHRRHDGARVARLSVLGRLPLLTAIEIVLDVALLLRGLTFIWPNLLPPFGDGARVVVMAAAVWAIVPIIDVLQVLVTRTQRRQFHRTGTELVAEVDGRACKAVDLTPRGIGVILAESIDPETSVWIQLDLPRLDGETNQVAARAVVRHSTAAPAGMHRIGARFTDLEPGDRDALVEFCALTAEHRDQTRAEATASTPEQLVVGGHGGRRSLLGAFSVVGALLAGLVVIAGPSPAGAAPLGGGGANSVVSGTVFDDTGAPFPNACISLQGQNGTGWGWAYTDQNGQYTAWSLSAGDYKVVADDCSGAGQANFIRTYHPSEIWENGAAVITVGDNDALAGIDVTFQRSARIHGTMVDDAATPLQNVCLAFVSTDGEPYSSNWWWAGSTDQNGAFDLWVPAGISAKLQIRDCNNEGRFYEQWFPDAEQANAWVFTPAPGSDEDLGQITLHSGAIIRGTITDTAGTPLQGICVNAQLTSQDNNWRWMGGTQTDVNGEYRFATRPGTYALQMNDCSGHQDLISQYYHGDFRWTPTPPTVDVVTGENGPFDLAMTVGGRISGRLTDVEGQPATGVCVGLHPKSDLLNNDWNTPSWTMTNSDGTWVSNAVAPDDYFLQFSSCDNFGYQEFGPWMEVFYPNVSIRGDLTGLVSLNVTSGNTTTGADAQLARAARISGVVRAGDGSPLENVCVGSADGDVRYMGDSGTASDGVYQASFAPGTHTLTFSDCRSGRGLVQQQLSLDLPEGLQTVDVTMTPGGLSKVVGSVRNDHGSALQPACAVAYVPDSLIGFSLVQPDGSFSIEGLGDGSYFIGTFNCEDPASGLVDVDDPSVTHPASWFGTPPVPIIVTQRRGPDPASDGATPAVLAGADATGFDFCFGPDCSAASPTTTSPPTTSPTTTVPDSTVPGSTVPVTSAPVTGAPVTTAPAPTTTVPARPVAATEIPDALAFTEAWARVESVNRLAVASKHAVSAPVQSAPPVNLGPPATTPVAAVAAVQAAMTATAAGKPDGIGAQVVGNPSGAPLGTAPLASSGSSTDPNGNRMSLMLAGLALMIVAAGSLVLVWRRQRAANSLI